MRNRIASAVVTLALASNGCAPKSSAVAAGPRPPGAGDVEVSVTGFAGDEGQVLIALFLDANGWPSDQSQAFGAVVLPISGGTAVTRFEGVPAGTFAVSVFHDEDLDRELDTGAFGIPSEDYGFSQDARGTFGPPSFDEARLEIAAGESKRITVKVE